jgi:hypothetical protein
VRLATSGTSGTGGAICRKAVQNEVFFGLCVDEKSIQPLSDSRSLTCWNATVVATVATRFVSCDLP